MAIVGSPIVCRDAAMRPSVPARGVKNRSAEIFKRLSKKYPGAHCELNHKNAFQLIAATILSAQCTDKRVNMVTPALFKKYPTPKAMANANPAELEEIIKSTGFYRNKARSLLGMSRALVEKHKGQVPQTMEELVQLPGVGRKTANVVLGNAFGINAGVVVDTHVGRISKLLGLTKQTDPVKVEQELMKLFPSKNWTMLPHLLIFHGRQVCIARRPRCGVCVLSDVCPSTTIK